MLNAPFLLGLILGALVVAHEASADPTVAKLRAYEPTFARSRSLSTDLRRAIAYVRRGQVRLVRMIAQRFCLRARRLREAREVCDLLKAWSPSTPAPKTSDPSPTRPTSSPRAGLKPANAALLLAHASKTTPPPLTWVDGSSTRSKVRQCQVLARAIRGAARNCRAFGCLRVAMAAAVAEAKCQPRRADSSRALGRRWRRSKLGRNWFTDFASQVFRDAKASFDASGGTTQQCLKSNKPSRRCLASRFVGIKAKTFRRGGTVEPTGSIDTHTLTGYLAYLRSSLKVRGKVLNLLPGLKASAEAEIATLKKWSRARAPRCRKAVANASSPFKPPNAFFEEHGCTESTVDRAILQQLRATYKTRYDAEQAKLRAVAERRFRERVRKAAALSRQRQRKRKSRACKLATARRNWCASKHLRDKARRKLARQRYNVVARRAYRSHVKVYSAQMVQFHASIRNLGGAIPRPCNFNALVKLNKREATACATGASSR